jgi:hypothetical protein
VTKNGSEIEVETHLAAAVAARGELPLLERFHRRSFERSRRLRVDE